MPMYPDGWLVALLTAGLCLGGVVPIHAHMPQASNLTFPTDFYGVDVSASVSESAFACLEAANLQFAIVRCYQSLGHVDPACAASVAAAHQGGLKAVHAYMFPCPKCGDPEGQVKTLLTHFKENQVNVTRLWLDIEGTAYWPTSATDSQAIYRALVDACTSLGLVCGVYSNQNEWSSIFGSAAFSYGATLPLWYAHYDGQPTFDDFIPFGGWGRPTIKQFNDQGAKCGVSYDLNWSPSLPL
jgi:GH25 family lysozyme M1 (1,4-beta-N-acetylmuramidase)